MKIAFTAPLKPLSHPVPSGDQIIARDLFSFFEGADAEPFQLTEFRSLHFLKSPRKIAKALVSQISSLRKALHEKPDVFFTYHTYHRAPDITAPWISAFLQKPYVIVEGSYAEKPRRQLATLPGYWLNRFALQRADHVFANMTEDLEGLRKILPADRITHLPPAVDVERFKPCPERAARFRERHRLNPELPLVSSTAMLRPDRKTEGVEFLIRSLGALARQGLAFQYVHAGGGEKLGSIRALAEQELGSRALIMGQTERDEIAEMLAASRVFAFPGIRESFGMVYLEAQASGCPVVAFNNAGVPDAVRHNETGILTHPFDSAAYQDALRRLLSNTSLWQTMAIQARQHVLTRHNRAENYQQVLEKLKALAQPRT